MFVIVTASTTITEFVSNFAIPYPLKADDVLKVAGEYPDNADADNPPITLVQVDIDSSLFIEVIVLVLNHNLQTLLKLS